MEALMIAIFLHMPWWVFALFALLVALGVQALRPRVVPLWRLLVTPAIFIAWGLVSLVLQLTASAPLFLFDWLITAAVGALLSWITMQPAAMRIEAGGVAVPGSALPLVRNLLIFSAKYALTPRVIWSRRINGPRKKEP
jgi:hypothetical protein